MEHKPQKRHKALQPLSREHHHGLLLSWKIRAGFSKNIAPKRIRAYADWFFKNHLIPHFELEETHIFSILEKDNELIKKALADHRRIKRLFAETENDAKTLSKIEEKYGIILKERTYQGVIDEINDLAQEIDLSFYVINYGSV